MKSVDKHAVLRVGNGRGFVVKDAGRERDGWHGERIVITAAHCLPRFPEAHAARDWDSTYRALLGPLGQEPTVWAELRFADPIADIAVLGAPDVFEQYEAYTALLQTTMVLRIADAPKDGLGRLLSLDGEWFDCKVQHFGGGLWITDAAKYIVGGMSGSPILNMDGSAIGVVCASSGRGNIDQHTEGGPNARLAINLPTQFLPRKVCE